MAHQKSNRFQADIFYLHCGNFTEYFYFFYNEAWHYLGKQQIAITEFF